MNKAMSATIAIDIIRAVYTPSAVGYLEDLKVTRDRREHSRPRCLTVPAPERLPRSAVIQMYKSRHKGRLSFIESMLGIHYSAANVSNIPHGTLRHSDL